MNSYFEAQSGFYGQTPGAPGGDYRFPIGLGGLSSMSPYGQHQPRPPQSDTSYDTPASPSKASSLYSSLTDSAAYRYVWLLVSVLKHLGVIKKLTRNLIWTLKVFWPRILCQ